MGDRELLALMASWLLIGFAIGCSIGSLAVVIFS